MSDGEFKKRLNKKYTDHTTYDTPYDYYRGSHTTKWVEELLEEAKKEFPSINKEILKMTQETNDPTIEQIVETISHIIDLAFDRKKWFEKWFGE